MARLGGIAAMGSILHVFGLLMKRATVLLPRQARRHALVGNPALWRAKRRFQIAFLREHGLQPDDTLLDIGCGTLRGGIPIIEYLAAGRYHGIDVRPDVLEEAKAELSEAGLQGKGATLLLLDAGFPALEIPRRFDVIWAFAVLIHMPDAAVEECFDFARRHLAPEGRFFANVSCGTGSRFPAVDRTFEFYTGLARRHGLALEDLGPLCDLGHRVGIARHDEQRMLRLILR